jgi:hypothetical protein
MTETDKEAAVEPHREVVGMIILGIQEISDVTGSIEIECPREAVEVEKADRGDLIVGGMTGEACRGVQSARQIARECRPIEKGIVGKMSLLTRQLT